MAVDEKALQHYGIEMVMFAFTIEAEGGDDEQACTLLSHGLDLLRMAATARVAAERATSAEPAATGGWEVGHWDVVNGETQWVGGTVAYSPTGPVVDGVEVATGRWACCGAIATGGHNTFCPGGPRVVDEAVAS